MPIQPTNYSATDSWPPTEVRPSPCLPDESALGEKSFLLQGPSTAYNSENGSVDGATRIEGRSAKANITSFSLSKLALDQQAKLPQTCPEPPEDTSDGDSDGEDYIRLPAGGFGHQYLLEDPPRCEVGLKQGTRIKKRSSFVRAIDTRRRSTGEVETARFRHSSRYPSPYAWCIEKEQDCGARQAIVREGEASHNKAGSKFSSRRAGSRNADVDDKVAGRSRERKVRFVLPDRAMAHRGGSRLDVGLVCFISAPSIQIKTYILILIWRSASLNSAPKKTVSDPDGWVSDFHLLFAIRDG